MVTHAEELTALDQAIGDGDHGLNMKRGFEAVLAELDKTAALPIQEALKAVGMTLVMKVGGASGPLYGTLFMALGKTFPELPTRAGVAQAFSSAIDAVKARGKSDVQMKTMLDVLRACARHPERETERTCTRACARPRSRPRPRRCRCRPCADALRSWVHAASVTWIRGRARRG